MKIVLCHLSSTGSISGRGPRKKFSCPFYKIFFYTTNIMLKLIFIYTRKLFII